MDGDNQQSYLQQASKKVKEQAFFMKRAMVRKKLNKIFHLSNNLNNFSHSSSTFHDIFTIW